MQHRSLFLSDLHLGARACRAGEILEFLNQNHAEKIYLVGDILDIWHVAQVYWSRTHDAILDELERRAAQGVEVIYLPGNHDDALRKGSTLPLRGFTLTETTLHETADGKKHLVLHGDQCDRRILRWHAITRIGSRMDAVLRGFDEWLRAKRGTCHAEETLIEQALKAANGLLSLGNSAEKRLSLLARAVGADGVICGHSHKPGLRSHDGIAYANCGDWVDSMTALVEDHNGQLRLTRFTETRQAQPNASNTALPPHLAAMRS
ncbi:MAG: UDP-2,3-diacylglucosamine hydrolase [Rhodobacterales bacterium]|nr:MAG: UDP-2,3-diacylglucosamine hydrolase [Rhodobacterales bacterium]